MDFNKPLNIEDWKKYFENFSSNNTNSGELDYDKNRFDFVKKIEQIGELSVFDEKSNEEVDIPVLHFVIEHTKTTARVKVSQLINSIVSEQYGVYPSLSFIECTDDEFDGKYRLSFVNVEQIINKKDNVVKEKSNPKRFTFLLGKDIPTRTAEEQLKKENFKSIENLVKAFSVEPVYKAFYDELADWYAWALTVVHFPNKIDNTIKSAENDIYNNEALIRLITRLIFVWFLKQKKLIPNEFFDEEYISKNLLKKFAPHAQVDLLGKDRTSKYYKAILQNLFFAMLNSPICSEKGEMERRFMKQLDKQYKGTHPDFNNNKIMRYEQYFKDSALFLKLANENVPFLNGGLFDCLDEKDNGFYLDGFSDNPRVQKLLAVPDFLFFGEDVGKNIDLSEFYGDSKKKKVSARGIIDILKSYNFTVEENTPLEQEISLDPELLGKVFENLLAMYNPETGTTARKQSGSFYTPREIVQYMVDESLVAHLKRMCGDENEEIYRNLIDYSDKEIGLSAAQKKEILHALYKCKILDPACGSGAFPMGILQQMVHILTKLDPTNEVWKEILIDEVTDETKDAYKNNTKEERAEVLADLDRSFNEKVNNPDYARKLYLIENSIFGVDIQSIAVQISKLRFFISLVVDQKTNSDAQENFGIRPLPNLEAKFVAANTLIGLQKTEVELFDFGDPRIKKIEDDLKIAKHKIFACKTYRTKKKYKEQIKVLRNELAELLVKENVIGQEQARQLASWDMFDQHSSAPFFDSEFMFGVKDGFDIVIGNPPYVQLQANGGELANQVQKQNYETFARTGDIYCIFYEKGIQLLCKQGIETFITSNKWMRAAYGEKTRTFFVKQNPLKLIDLGSGIFDSATVDTNILILQKGENKNELKAVTANKKDFETSNFSPMTFETGDIWTILSPIEQSIKAKIEKIGTPLKDWDIEINRGILTGYNEAFIIDTEKRDEILANCKTDDETKRTEELIRPILRGKDIKRYSANWANLWLINTHNGIKDKNVSRIDVRNYPSVKAHLDNHYEKLVKRADQGDTPYNLRNCAYISDFSKPKIAWKALGLQADFTFIEDTIYNNDKGNLLTSSNKDEKYLLATFNSKLFFWQFSKIGIGMGEGFEFKVQYMKLMFVKILAKVQQQPFINIVNKLLQAKKDNPQADTSKLEAEIDKLMYELYGLTEEEIAVVEGE